MLDDTYFMKQALIEAGKAAERGEVPVGAVVVCKERIIARAHNLTETLNDVTAHAEMQAITAAANVLGGNGPAIVEVESYRWFGHSTADARNELLHVLIISQKR